MNTTKHSQDAERWLYSKLKAFQHPLTKGGGILKVVHQEKVVLDWGHY